MTSDLETWCPQGSVGLLVVGSVGMSGVLSSTPHGIGPVYAGFVRIVQSGHTQNTSDPLSTLCQISAGMTQIHNHSVITTIFPVGPDTTSSSVGSAFAVLND